MKSYIYHYPTAKRSKRYLHAATMLTMITVSGLISAGVAWKIYQLLKP